MPGCERNQRKTGRERRANRSRPGTVGTDASSNHDTSTHELFWVQKTKQKFIKIQIELLCFFPGTTVIGLHTVIAHNYSVVHNIAKHSDDDAEKSQKNPILADFGERIAPYKGNDSKETRSPFAAISAQLFASLLLFFLSRLLRFTKFSRLLSGVFSKTPRVPAVHLIVFHASLTSERQREGKKKKRKLRV